YPKDKGMEKDTPHNDRTYFRLLVDRPDEAMEAIYARYYGQMFAFIRCFIIDDDDLIKDVVQETLIVVWEDREKFAALDNPYFYMLTVAKYKTHEKFREKEKQSKAPLEEGYNISGDDKADGKLLLEELQEEIRRAVEKLPATQRAIFRDSKMNELSDKEMMERHSLARQTVKNTRSTAIKKVWEHVKSLFTIFI